MLGSQLCTVPVRALDPFFTQIHDYQWAKCEHAKVICEWFALVWNTKAKYGIVDEDVYNFDKTRFMMGIFFAGMVVTTSDGCGKAKLAQPGNCEWATVIQGMNTRSSFVVGQGFLTLQGK